MMCKECTKTCLFGILLKTPLRYLTHLFDASVGRRCVRHISFSGDNINMAVQQIKSNMYIGILPYISPSSPLWLNPNCIVVACTDRNNTVYCVGVGVLGFFK